MEKIKKIRYLNYVRKRIEMMIHPFLKELIVETHTKK